jgi:hypothetical protein
MPRKNNYNRNHSHSSKGKIMANRSQHPVSARLRTRLSSVKPRRLFVESIEDRLLLSATYQGGMELSLTSQYIHSSDFVIVSSNPQSNYLQFDSNSSGTFLHYAGNGCISDLINVIPNAAGQTNQYVGGGIQPINLPTSFSPNAPIAIGNPPGPSPTSSENLIAAKTDDSSAVKSEKTPVSSFGNVTPRMEVEGTRGRCQVFEIAMSVGNESRQNLARVPHTEEQIAYQDAKIQPVRHQDSFVKAGSFPSKMDISLTTNRQTATPSPSASSVVERHSASNLAATSASFAVSNFNPAVATVEESMAAELPKTDSDSALPLERPTVSSADSRKLVFAEIGEQPKANFTTPDYFGDYRSKNWYSVALVAIAGQQLFHKWKRTSIQSETKQLPPRRSRSTT